MSCLLIALIGLGLNAYRKLAVDELPQIDIPYISIMVTWVGATPEEMEVDVVKKLEDAVSSLDGLKHIYSYCMENVANVVMEFQLDRNVDVVAVDVREKIDAVLDDLPADCNRPIIEKIDINATSVVTLALTGNATLDELYDYADNTLSDRFSTVSGVSKVELVGGNEMEVHVELDRKALSEAGLTTASIIGALRANILSLPAGRVREDGNEVSVKFDAEYSSLEGIASLEVATVNGMRRYLRDFARVSMASEDIRQNAFIDGKPCIQMNILKKGEANAVAVVSKIRRQVEDVRKMLPPGLELIWYNDSGKYVQATANNTLSDILSGVVLCALILLFFLANIGSTLIVAISMPLTIIISMFFLNLIGYSLNISTLLAIGLSVGILVSNSIVVLENVVKRFHDISNPWEAARVGTNEVAIAVLASAGTNVVVMLPIGMMSSIIGLIFVPFALTTLIVNVVSIFISFTLTPILCALFIRPARPGREGLMTRLGKMWEAKLTSIGQGYAAVLRTIARSRLAIVALLLLPILLMLHAFSFAGSLGFTFFNPSDRSAVFVSLEFPTYYDLGKTVERLNGVAERLKGLSDIEHILATAGKVNSMGNGANEAVYLSQIQMVFKDKTQRQWNIFQRLDEISHMLENETDCIATVAVESAMGGLSTPVNLQISGDNLDDLNRYGLAIADMLRNIHGTDSINTTVRDGKPQLLITPKRSIMADLGISARDLATIMRGNLDGIEAATFKRGDRSFDIRVKYNELPGKEQVRQFLLPGRNGQPVLLETYADISETQVPVMINRTDKMRIVNVTSTLAKDGKLGLIMNEINRQVAEKNLLPTGYSLKAAGDAEFMEEGIKDFIEAALLAIFLTYLTLSAILESFVRPFLILFTLPLGLIGVLWSLRLTGEGISIFVMLGIVMLIGVVVNAAVLIIDRLSQLTAQGMSRRESMLHAVADTFRAVLMVILASSLGMLPLALGKGLGSELRTGIGIASTGGVIVSGILSLLVLPLLYILFTPKDKGEKLTTDSGR